MAGLGFSSDQTPEVAVFRAGVEVDQTARVFVADPSVADVVLVVQ